MPIPNNGILFNHTARSACSQQKDVETNTGHLKHAYKDLQVNQNDITSVWSQPPSKFQNSFLSTVPNLWPPCMVANRNVAHQKDIYIYIASLKPTYHMNISLPQAKLVFQPLLFRGYVGFSRDSNAVIYNRFVRENKGRIIIKYQSTEFDPKAPNKRLWINKRNQSWHFVHLQGVMYSNIIPLKGVYFAKA